MAHWNLRACQQSLAGRGIRLSRETNDPVTGEERFRVWPSNRPRFTGRVAGDVDMAYIMGLRMASNRERGGQGGVPALA